MKHFSFSSDEIKGRESADYLRENTLRRRFLFGKDFPSETVFSLEENRGPLSPFPEKKQER